MSKSRYRGLIGLNICLLVVLALITLTPGAQARQAASRPHGQYAMVSAQVQGQTEAAIVVVDAANEEMAALKWDRSRRVLTPIGYRNLRQDAQLRERQGR
jgi:hypothetical protein